MGHLKNREVWVDYAKGIGIILVVYGHVIGGLFNSDISFQHSTYAPSISIIYTFHMPLFFFLSGLFFYQSLIKRGAWRMFANRCDTIVYPYFLWSWIQGSLLILLSIAMGKFSASQLYGLISIIWKPLDQFWFLYALFFISMVCIVFYTYIKHAPHTLLIILFLCLYLVKPYIPDLIPLGFISFYGIFFALGIWFSQFKEKVFLGAMKFFIPSTVLFFLAQYYYHVHLALVFPDGGYLLLVLSMLSIAFVITFSMVLSSISLTWLAFLGSSSMSIYLMHIIIGSGARTILSKGLHIEDFYIHLTVGFLLALLVPVLIQLVLNRYRLSFILTAPHILSLEKHRLN